MPLLAVMLLIGLRVTAQSDSEITLYSEKGKPIAYVTDDDDSTIYLWNGKPVAYIDGTNIYGFNGKHLGWFQKGRIYDYDGAIVGATKSHLESVPQLDTIKSLKELKPLKSLKELAPLKPIFGLTWSEDETLRSFLLGGAD